VIDAAGRRAAARMQRAAAWVAVLAVALAAVGAAAWTAQRPRFDIRRIVVLGDAQHVSEQALRQAIAGRLAGNYFTIGLADAQRVFETVPWVARASIRRVWPDRLVVTLTEHRPIGVWSDGRLLSDAGILFEANPAEAEATAAESGRPALVEFSGPARIAAEAAMRLREFEPELARCGLAVAAIEISDRAGWSVQARNGPRLVLGRDEPAGALRERLAAVASVYPTLVARIGAPPLRIDARYPNGLAVASPPS